jgi:DNA-binding transcriptional LysR family regulator
MRLGVRRSQRRARRLSLKEFGPRYLEQARAAFMLGDDAKQAKHGAGESELKGRVWRRVPTTYSH